MNQTDNQNMMHSKNQISGEAKPLSLVVREYIARHCVTLASYMPDQYLVVSRDEQTQPTNKNHLSLKGVTNK